MKRLIMLVAMMAIMAVVFNACSKSGDAGPTGPSTPPDTTNPRILSVNPPQNSINVTSLAQIRITFSEPIDPATLDTMSIRLFFGHWGGNPLSCAYTTSGNDVIVTPNVPINDNQLYTIDVTNRVRDLAGLSFGPQTQWQYATIPIRTTNPQTWGVTIGESTERSTNIRLIEPHLSGGYLVCGTDAGPWGRNEALAVIQADGTTSWFRDEMFRHEWRVDPWTIAQTSGGGIAMFGGVNEVSNDGVYSFVYSTGGVPANNHFIGYDYYPYAVIGNDRQTFFVCGYEAGWMLAEMNYFGTILWSKRVHFTESATDLVQLPNKNIALCGFAFVYPLTERQMAVVVTDDTAGVIWHQSYGTGRLEALCYTPADQLITAGYSGASAGQQIAIGIALDGTKLWQAELGAGLVRDIRPLADGGVIVLSTPMSRYGMILTRLGSDGQIVWQRNHDDIPEPHGIQPVSDGYLIAAGNLYKVDLNGNF